MSLLKPLPDRSEFEREVHGIFDEGDITFMASLLRVDRSNVSRMLNPDDPRRHNFWWLATAAEYALDLQGQGKADEVIAIRERYRMSYLPKPLVKIDLAKAGTKVVDEVMDLFAKKMAGESPDVILKEAIDIRQAADRLISGVLSHEAHVEPPRAVATVF
jgi:hypothetical protein